MNQIADGAPQQAWFQHPFPTAPPSASSSSSPQWQQPPSHSQSPWPGSPGQGWSANVPPSLPQNQHQQQLSYPQQQQEWNGGQQYFSAAPANDARHSAASTLPPTSSVPPLRSPRSTETAGNVTQQQQHSQHQQHQQQHPMAAPPFPHAPSAEGQQYQNQYQQQPPPQQSQQSQQQPQQPQPTASRTNSLNNTTLSPPQSPNPSSGPREQARISLLLEINVLLLEEVNRLQSQGQGGAINPQQVAQLKAAGQPEKMASDEYIQCLRRVQANLTYLMPRAQKEVNPNSAAAAGNTDPPKQNQHPGPAHMTPPPAAENLDALREKYESLRELFPGWQGLDHRLSGSKESPRPGAPQQQQQQQQQQGGAVGQMGGGTPGG